MYDPFVLDYCYKSFCAKGCIYGVSVLAQMTFPLGGNVIKLIYIEAFYFDEMGGSLVCLGRFFCRQIGNEQMFALGIDF